MYIKTERLLELGVSRKTIEAKVAGGEWQVGDSETVDKEPDEILLASLPQDLQSAWAKNNLTGDATDLVASLLSESSERDLDEHAEEIRKRLLNLPLEERQAWLAESLRMSLIAERYGAIEPKRQRNTTTGELDFVPGVYELCVETACRDHLITSKRPHRSKVIDLLQK
jgi:hypothetical protein